MPYPCSHCCGCVSDTPEERARHERSCPERTISCCQAAFSCSRKIRDWTLAEEHKTTCRHGSHGLFGAIREDNVELVQLFLLQRKPNLSSLFTHETDFGETILTYAASLGRSEIVRVLLKTIHTIVQNGSDTFALSDLLDHETSRGKSAIVEAAKSNRLEVVAVLLAHHANAQLPSRIHRKSALDWAVALGHDAIVEMIDEHVKLEEHARALFQAVAKFDVPAVKSLTEGGASFQQGQDAMFQHQLELKRRALRLAEQNLDDASRALQEVDQSKDATRTEIQAREKHISCLDRKREDVESRRRNEVREATAQVHQALTSAHALQGANNPPLEYELISKALCKLLHVRVRSVQSDDGAEGEPVMPHWTEIKRLLQDSSRFFHRVRHYHFEIHVVELAAAVQIEGLPGTCADHLSSILKRDTEDQTSVSPLIVALARWLSMLFQHVEAHKLAHSLLMEASDERDILERQNIDFQVLTSRAAIHKRERDETNASIDSCKKQIAQLERKMEISRVMRFVAGGHSVLSWAASAGNEELVKLLLKRGAHTAIGDDCFGWCATIVQLAFRRHLQRRELTDISLGANERRKQDLIVSLRTKSLGNLIRERLRGLHLPLAEALFNGNSNIVSALSDADIPPSQALNLFPMFRRPQGMFPRPSTDGDAVSNAPSINGSELLSHLVEAGQLYSLEPDPSNHANSLRCAIELFIVLLHQRRQKVEEKIAKRKETLHHRFRRAKISELASAIQRGDFVGMVNASDDGSISLDYEDPTTALTPLIRAAQEDIHSPLRCKDPMGEACTAVAYLLDRITTHRPAVDYENANGHTALAMACMQGRLEVVRDLVERGADVDRMSNLLHCTAYDLAVDAKQLDVVEFLDQRRSKPK